MTKTEAPVCARCDQLIDISQEYELLAETYLHKTCYDECLLTIILSAPTMDELKQMKAMRKMMTQFQHGQGSMMDMMMGKMIGSGTTTTVETKDSST